jgi:hypothetical protein
LGFRGFLFREIPMKKTALIATALLFACTSLSDLKKPSTEQYFVLTEDHVRVEIRGLANFKWVEGLKAGKYVSAAEDDEGIFFKGEGACVILLANEDAESYLRDRKVPASVQNNANVGLGSALGVGGLWIPKKGIDKGAKLFYELRNASDGSAMGATGVGIVAMTEGSLGYRSYGSEKAFVESLKILAK